MKGTEDAEGDTGRPEGQRANGPGPLSAEGQGQQGVEVRDPLT